MHHVSRAGLFYAKIIDLLDHKYRQVSCICMPQQLWGRWRFLSFPIGLLRPRKQHSKT